MLQSLKAVERLTSSKTFRSSVVQMRSEARVIRLIEDSGVDVKSRLSASDIMEPVPMTLARETPIFEAVDALARVTDEGLPVVDDKGRLVGELTTKEVLQLGMPRYMNLLMNPEMLNEFEPFENYFTQGPKMTVGDICRHDFGAVSAETPIVASSSLQGRM